MTKDWLFSEIFELLSLKKDIILIDTFCDISSSSLLHSRFSNILSSQILVRIIFELLVGLANN